MGTNYYAQTVICKHCGSVERWHIGKSSAGWKFLFQGSLERGIYNFEDVRKLIEKADAIVDEYGKTHNLHEFLAFVEKKQLEPNIPVGAWHDARGFCFAEGDFS